MYSNVSEVKSIFGERLKQVMDWDDVGITELSNATGLAQVTIRNILNGGEPSSTTICKIADYLNVSVDYLLGRVDECDEVMAKGYFNAARILSYEAYLKHNKKTYPIEDGYFTPWPYNLAEQILGADAFDDIMTADQANGLEYILNYHTTDRTKDILLMRYKDEMTLEEISGKIHLTTERVRQIIKRSVWSMRHRSLSNYILNGLEGERKRREMKNLEIKYARECSELEHAIRLKNIELAKVDEAIKESRKMNIETSLDISKIDLSKLDDKITLLDLSIRSYNCLSRAGCDTIGDVLELIKKNDAKADVTEPAEDILYWNLLKIRNMGKRSATEVIDKLIRLGYLKDAV